MRNFLNILLLLTIVAVFSQCEKGKYETKNFTDENGYKYEIVTNEAQCK